MAAKILNVTEVRQQFSHLVRTLDDPIFVTVYGKPQAVMLTYETYETLLSKIEAQDRNQIMKSKERAAQQLLSIRLTDVPEPEELTEEIRRAVET